MPRMPVLPGRLRLDDDDEDDADASASEGGDEADVTDTDDIDVETYEYDPLVEVERKDRQRIERLLGEMMARQRAKTGTRPSHVGVADVDVAESSVEKDELMTLITASLRREVARAEDDAWMYGDSASMGVGPARDDLGVYN